ncbi:hypothetical protein CRUP_026096 [Coryphaenoides rupestris]|nr:hypothetical protein CRUP_026096 [Coryphaenoides rupestris]
MPTAEADALQRGAVVALLVVGQRLQQVGVAVVVVDAAAAAAAVVVVVVVVAVVGAIVRAAAAGRAVVRRVAGVARRPDRAGVGVAHHGAHIVGEEAATDAAAATTASQAGVDHPPDAAVARRGCRLRFDMEVLRLRERLTMAAMLFLLAGGSRGRRSGLRLTVMGVGLLDCMFLLRHPGDIRPPGEPQWLV